VAHELTYFQLKWINPIHRFLSLSSQPEGATSEEEAFHLSEEGLPGSGSGSGLVRVKPEFSSCGSTGLLQPREQNYDQGEIT